MKQVPYEVFKAGWYLKSDSKRELKRRERQRRQALERQQHKAKGNHEGGNG